MMNGLNFNSNVTCDAEWQNGGVIVYRALLDNAVLYPNPYITITPQDYTKHYYIGQERIASATGGGRWDVTPDHLNNREADIIDDYWGHYTSNNPFEEVSGGKTDNENLAGNTPSVLQYDCAPSQLFRLGLKWEDDMLSSCINTYLQYSGSETTYFTHNDHLGSASWITDPHGYPIQYIHYAPYGELLADQKPTGSTYDERYKFTGKERDAETGYDYFGARFLAQQLGIWLSVDPLADKYPGISPYAYCNWNPIKFVDSEGTHPLVAAALAVVAPEIVAATALVGVVIYYNLTHQEEWNNTSSWEGNKPFSEVRDTRVGLEWQNRQDRKAKRAAELQEMEHQQFLQDNLPDPSPDPNKGKDPKGTAEQVGIGTLVAIGIGVAAELYRAHKENTTPKMEIKNDTQTSENAETTIKQIE